MSASEILEIALYVIVVGSVLFLTLLAGIALFGLVVLAAFSLYYRLIEPPIHWVRDRYDLRGDGKDRILRRLFGTISYTALVAGVTSIAFTKDEVAAICLAVASVTGIWWAGVPRPNRSPRER